MTTVICIWIQVTICAEEDKNVFLYSAFVTNIVNSKIKCNTWNRKTSFGHNLRSFLFLILHFIFTFVCSYSLRRLRWVPHCSGPIYYVYSALSSWDRCKRRCSFCQTLWFVSTSALILTKYHREVQGEVIYIKICETYDFRLFVKYKPFMWSFWL